MLWFSASGSLSLSRTCMNCQMRDIFVRLAKSSPGGNQNIWIELLATMQNHCSLCRVISSFTFLHEVEWIVWMIEKKKTTTCWSSLSFEMWSRTSSIVARELLQTSYKVFWYRGQNVSFSVHVQAFKNITPVLHWDICLRIKSVFEWHISDEIECMCLKWTLLIHF